MKREPVQTIYASVVGPGGVQQLECQPPPCSGRKRGGAVRKRVCVLWTVKVLNTDARKPHRWWIYRYANGEIKTVGEKGLKIARRIQVATVDGYRWNFDGGAKWIGDWVTAGMPMTTEDLLFGGPLGALHAPG